MESSFLLVITFTKDKIGLSFDYGGMFLILNITIFCYNYKTSQALVEVSLQEQHLLISFLPFFSVIRILLLFISLGLHSQIR